MTHRARTRYPRPVDARFEGDELVIYRMTIRLPNGTRIRRRNGRPFRIVLGRAPTISDTV